MAVNDSTAPKGIPKTGEVSPGSNKADRSINLVKNIKTSTSRTTANTSIDSLRNWFRTYVGTTGNFSNNKSAGQQVNLSDFHDTTILGIGITTTNETSSTYGTNNNAKVFLRGYFSDKNSYGFLMNGVRKIAFHGDNVSFIGLQGGEDGKTGTEYTVTVQAYSKTTFKKLAPVTTNSQPEVQFRITPGYGGAAKVRGVNDTGVGSFGNTSFINFTYSGGAGKGKTSNELYLLQGLQDPSGRTYGPSMSYP
jgi:hypothetical protein